MNNGISQRELKGDSRVGTGDSVTISESHKEN